MCTRKGGATLLSLGRRGPQLVVSRKTQHEGLGGEDRVGRGWGLRLASYLRLCLGGDLLPSLAWPCPSACLPLASHTPSFLGTCRCFRCQSQGPEEGRASAHIILKGGLRGQGFQVVHLEGGAHFLPPGTYLLGMKVLTSAPWAG